MGNSTRHIPFATTELASIHVGVLDCKTKHRITNYRSKRIGGGVRSEIREFSRQSRSRLIYRARNIPGLNSFITFTYPHGDYAATATGGDFMADGLAVKDHLRKLRQVMTYRGFYGLWFLEFQQRGAPHFHFFVCGTLSESDKMKLRRTWHRMVGSGCPHHLERGVDIQALRAKHSAGAYAAKYSSKSEQKTVPDRYHSVGRFWGSFGEIPENNSTLDVSIGQLFKLARIARNYTRANARAAGYQLKKTPHHGLTGGSLYGAAPVLLAYLSRFYTGLESLPGTTLTARNCNSLEWIPRSRADILAARVPQDVPLSTLWRSCRKPSSIEH